MKDEEQLVGLRLVCRGTLQGVGFRPMVLRLGASLGLGGWVENRIDGVELELVGPRGVLEHFQALLPGALPASAQLDSLEATWIEPGAPIPAPGTMRIRQGEGLDGRRTIGASWLAPGLRADRAPCRRCWLEFNDPKQRRFRDPFISCCDCGPRYAISSAIPYRRSHTTMANLPICADCGREAADPNDRRFHCETISCPACGPRLRWLGSEGTGAPLDHAIALLANGGILALQGIGGFQLLVAARNAEAIERLRQRKRRPHQPLALLVERPDALADAVTLSPAERRLLQSPAAPIVLLRRRPLACRSWPGVADGAAALGLMLPASGLHHLLVEGHGGPLVATSANRHGEPMWIREEDAREGLGAIADGVLLHDRTIVRPLDDSLAQVVEGRARLLRRARGHAPEPIQLPAGAGGRVRPAEVLALGADLTSAPALAIGPGLWLAPPFGSLDHPRIEARFQRAVEAVLDAHPHAATAMACDAHPGYRSSRVARDGRRRSLGVGHHQAHGLAVLAEHGLEGPMLMLCADGVGFDPSDDRPVVRGCELLLVPQGPGPIQRLGGLRPFLLPGGDRACREPRRCALGLLLASDPPLWSHPGAAASRQAFAADALRLVIEAAQGNCNSPVCTSLGRLFDAVASLLDLVQVLTFDGQGGQAVEGAAAAATDAEPGTESGIDSAWMVVRHPTKPSTSGPARHPAPPPGTWELDWQPWLHSCLEARVAGVPARILAARFQQALARGLAELATEAARPAGSLNPAPIVRVALAGGCFQNGSLLRHTAAQLRRRGLQPYWSEQVPCHDGGLALGQVAALRRQTAADRAHSKQSVHL